VITKNRREEEKKRNVRRRGEKTNVKRERERERDSFCGSGWLGGFVPLAEHLSCFRVGLVAKGRERGRKRREGCKRKQCGGR